jgi:replicative DNA helicase
MRLVDEARGAIDGPTPGNGPQVRAVERALLGSILTDCALLTVCVLDGLKADHFASAGHRLIFGAMLARRSKKARFDSVLLSADLEDAGTLEDIGGASYLSFCLDNTDIDSISEYIAVVKDAACARRIGKGTR